MEKEEKNEEKNVEKNVEKSIEKKPGKADSANKSAPKPKKGKVGKLQLSVLLRTVLPMLLMGIIIGVAAERQYQESVLAQMEDSLKLAAETAAYLFDAAVPGDYRLVGTDAVSLYKGETELTGQFEQIDSVQELTGYELSLFYGNTRILTTFLDTEGQRAVATGINSTVPDMLEQQDHVFLHMDAFGLGYYAVYVPLKNSDGSTVGMFGAAVSDTAVRTEIVSRMRLLWIITAVCVALAICVSLLYTGGLIRDIKSIRKFVQGMIRGELGNEMAHEVLRREDELGEIGNDVVRMQSSIRTLVEQDMLTGLLNRRCGAKKYRRILADSSKTGMPCAVAIGDIDFFKQVNDTYGHEAGDEVLRTAAAVMKKHLTGKGIVSRWGGEEFLLVFDRQGSGEAEKELQGILEEIRNLCVKSGDREIRLTMTFGIVDGSLSQDNEELLRRADGLLYYGKTHGRNRVVIREDDGND